MTGVLAEPMALQEWMKENLLGQNEKLYFKQAGVGQACFVRDNLHGLLISGKDGDERYLKRKENPVRVVSTHRSKSVVLPVYEIWVPEVTVRLRGNFYNWMVSVATDQRPVPDLFHTLIRRDKAVHPVHCEGFLDEWVYGSFSEDRSRFTVELRYEYDLWAFVYLLSVAVGVQ